MTAAGKVGPAGAVKVALSWRATGPFPLGPVVIDGAARGTGDIGGTLAAPTADLITDLAAVDLPSLPLRAAHLVTRLQPAAGGIGGRFSLAASSQYGPARAEAAFDFAGGGIEVSGLDANAGGLKVAGAFALKDSAPSSADLTWSAGPGAFLEAGHASGRARLVDAADGGARRPRGQRHGGAVPRRPAVPHPEAHRLRTAAPPRLPRRCLGLDRRHAVPPRGNRRLQPGRDARGGQRRVLRRRRAGEGRRPAHGRPGQTHLRRQTATPPPWRLAWEPGA